MMTALHSTYTKGKVALSIDVKTRLFIYGALEQVGLGNLPSLKSLHR